MTTKITRWQCLDCRRFVTTQRAQDGSDPQVCAECRARLPFSSGPALQLAAESEIPRIRRKLAIEQLRELAASATRERPGTWQLQTSNSFRRIGREIGTTGKADEIIGDGDVLCAVNHPVDRHPDLLARADVLEYIVAAQPRAVLALLEDLDNAETMLAAPEVHWECQQKIDALESEVARMRPVYDAARALQVARFTMVGPWASELATLYNAINAAIVGEPE